MKPNRIVCLLLTGLWACAPKLQVTKMDLPARATEMPSIPDDDPGGMYYALPLSIVTVDIPVTQTERAMGGCFVKTDSFNVRLLRERLGEREAKKTIAVWDTAKDKTRTFFKLHTDEIKVSSRPAPDPTKVYYTTLKNKWNRNQQLTISLNELGQLAKGEFVNENHTFDLIVQGVQSVAGIVSALSPVKAASANDTVTIDGQVSAFGKRNVCYELKKNILTVRSTRFDLLKAPSNLGDPTIFKRRLDELDALEEKLISSLTYEETKTKVILHVDVLVPTPASLSTNDIKASLSNVPLFNFHKEKGIEIFAKPKPGSYQNEYLLQFGQEASAAKTTDGFKAYYLAFDYAQGEQVVDRAYASAGGSTDKVGIAYNVPAWVRGRVQTIDGATKGPSLAVAMLPMPQLGKVAYLPERASKVGFELDPITGALRTVSLQQTGLTADQIKAAGEAASSGVIAVKKPTQLKEIQDENALLEQQIKKITQQNTLDSLNNIQLKVKN